MRVAIVVGNPKPRSRTWAAAHRVAQAMEPDSLSACDLVDIGPHLLTWGDPIVSETIAEVQRSDILIVGSPTYKATYSGLLKLFLDQLQSETGLAGVIAVPLMLGGDPGHRLAGEVHLKPVLSELGAIVPAPSLFLLESDADGERHWVSTWAPVIRRLARDAE